MNLSLVSAWCEESPFTGDFVKLVYRKDGRPFMKSLPAKWTFFVKGLGEDERAALARDGRVTGARLDEHGYFRVDCKYRKARRVLISRLRDWCDRTKRDDVEIFEGDVGPVRRVLSDHPSIEVSDSPRLVYIDIETDARKAIALHKEGEARILSWAICDAEMNSRGEVLKADDDDSEREMLERLIGALEPYDCVLAWYGDGYDFEVIRERCRVLNVHPGGKGIPWFRWTWLDHLEVFKKYNIASDQGGEAKSSFALGHVAGYLLGETKLDFDASKTWEAWEERPDELLAYNVQDVELLPKIEAKTGFVALHLAVCKICRVLPDTDSLKATHQGDGFLLRLGDEYGYRWPTKVYGDDVSHEQFEGAYVMRPTRLGAVDSVHVCDFSGLYPSIIRTWNMSPDTKIKGSAEPGPGVCQLPTARTCFRTDSDGMFRIALDRLVGKRAEYQAMMKKETHGSPEYVKAKNLQAAFKIVANSFYGILGSQWSRFFDVQIAEGVTKTARWLLQSVIEEARERGLDPFYGDTDSVFVAGESEAMSTLVADMNASWGERLEPWGIEPGSPNHIDLDFEKTFSRIIMISAKRYAGRFVRYKGKDAGVDAKPEVKGLEFKRGDTINLARQMQVEIVYKLLGIGEPFDTPLPGHEEMREILNRWKETILRGELDIADVTLSQSISKRPWEYLRFTKAACPVCGSPGVLTKDPQIKGYVAPDPVCPSCGGPRKIASPPMHVRVALEMIRQGKEVLVGNRIRYLVTVPPRDSDAQDKSIPVAADTPGAFERIDREYYWGRVGKASQRVLEKAFPEHEWGDTGREKKDRKVARLRAERRGSFSEMPLFRHFGVEDDEDEIAAGIASTTGARTVRTRRRMKSEPEPTPAPERPKVSPLNDEDRERIRTMVASGDRFDVGDYCITYGKRPSEVRPYAMQLKASVSGGVGANAGAVPTPQPKRRRRRKAPPAVEAAPEQEPTPPPKRRRRRRVQPIEYRITEQSTDVNGGAEAHRRSVLLSRFREVLDEHPGTYPVRIVVVLPSKQAKVTIPCMDSEGKPYRIDPSPEAFEKISKIMTATDELLGWPPDNQ